MKTLLVSITAAALLAISAAAPAAAQSSTPTTSAAPAAPVASAAPTTRREAAAQWSEDGLRKVEARGLDLAYARPGADLSVYHKVLVKPVSVAFRRNWERDMAIATGTRIRASDTQRIRDELAQIVRDEVAGELAKGGYQVVEAPGEDVLELDLSVVELQLNAPDLPTPGVVRSYTVSFGEMTLIADLHDSATGQTVMRILDHDTGRDFGVLRYTTRVENAREMRITANAWARALRKQLDLAKRIGGQS